MTSWAVPNSCKVYTAPPLAAAIVAALRDAPDAQWLEPSVGKGVFVDALATQGVHRSRIRAIDIDPAVSAADAKAKTYRGVDFLAWASKTRQRFDRIAGNPPFVSLEALKATARKIACAAPTPASIQIPNGCNYWYAFLCASITLLNPGGHIGFILPSAWEYADYANNLRTVITKLFAEIITHRCEQPLFPSVQEGSVVLIARGFGQQPQRSLRVLYRNSNELKSGLRRDLPLRGPTAIATRTGPERSSIRLGDFMKIGIGAVCGDAAFFLLTETERRELGLPLKSVRPALTKARHLIAAEVTRNVWESLRDAGERIWLFRPSEHVKHHARVRRYLRLPFHMGGCNREATKVRNRSPWYRIVLPKRSDGFISGMSHFGPLLCLNKMPDLTVSNTLYTVKFSARITIAQRYTIAIAMQTTEAAAVIAAGGRRYAEGLIKFEPCDLENIRIRVTSRKKGARAAYRQIAAALMRGDKQAARSLADTWSSFHSSIALRAA